MLADSPVVKRWLELYKPSVVAVTILAVGLILGVAVIALAPEGYDQPEGVLGPLPPGAGRFIEKIAQTCQPIVPIGVYEDEQSLCLRFGRPFLLENPNQASAAGRDQAVSRQILDAIALLLPPDLLNSS